MHLKMVANSRHLLSDQSQECGCVNTQILSDNFSVIMGGKSVIIFHRIYHLATDQ